jgi:hypothetical protein
MRAAAERLDHHALAGLQAQAPPRLEEQVALARGMRTVQGGPDAALRNVQSTRLLRAQGHGAPGRQLPAAGPFRAAGGGFQHGVDGGLHGILQKAFRE